MAKRFMKKNKGLPVSFNGSRTLKSVINLSHPPQAAANLIIIIYINPQDLNTYRCDNP